MAEFFIRTEEIKPEEIADFFVETRKDRDIIEQLKSRNPVVLVGSRGVGKSFLFRMAEFELSQQFSENKVLPVYITFRKSSLIHTSNQSQFHHWMIARICNELLRGLQKLGVVSMMHPSFSILAGDKNSSQERKSKIEQIVEAFENSWQRPGQEIDTSNLPSIDSLLDAVEDICVNFSINRIVLFIDEAAHVFWPEQQRQFFTLFRDLRSPYITCNAAVYPGVTAYGDTFQPIHDATVLTLNRDIQDDGYVLNMKEIVIKQAEGSAVLKNVAKRGENFAVLAFAASGNPRHLLKTLVKSEKLDSDSVNNVVREYYRTDVWSEHSGLAEKYPGHRFLVDWGRKFIETEVLPELQRKNEQYLQEDKKTTCFFWMHRDVPQVVKEALRLLEYTGIVTENSTGIKATRSEVGTRYSVNLGCLMALENKSTATGLSIAKSITPKRMSEYGANYKYYDLLLTEVPNFSEPDMSEVLKRELQKPIGALDLTSWQFDKLTELHLGTVGDILRASETRLQQAYYVGEKRARRIRNVAIAAVYEYLSG